MIDLFACIILTALFVNGLYIATGPNMLLEPLKDWIKSKIGARKIYKTLIGCVKCMTSIYGTIIALLILPHSIDLIWQITLVIACGSTVATIINTQYV